MSIIYLFDPLCGWCYAVSKALAQLAGEHEIRPMATGLFASCGMGGRVIDDGFATHAWTNDSRIMAMTGLPFSQAYQQQVLQVGNAFDSWALSCALKAIEVKGGDVLSTLAKLQHARYVDAKDTSQADVVAQLLGEFGLADVAKEFLSDDNAKRTQAGFVMGQQLMQRLGLQGVPKLLLQKDDSLHVIPSEWLFGDLAELNTKVMSL